MRWLVPVLLAIAPLTDAAARPGDAYGFVLLSPAHSTSMGSVGRTDDWRRAEALRSGAAPLIYVRDGAAAWVVRDPAVIRSAEALLRPQRELGERQRALGSQQAVLGREQAALGREQSRLGRTLVAAGPRDMTATKAQMEALAFRQAALGERQGALGTRQGELGRRQRQAGDAALPRLRALVADAVRRGLAQRVD